MEATIQQMETIPEQHDEYDGDDEEEKKDEDHQKHQADKENCVNQREVQKKERRPLQQQEPRPDQLLLFAQKDEKAADFWTKNAYDKKREEIEMCLNGGASCLSDEEVDLWRLRSFALSKGGFLCPGVRRRAWPKLLALHQQIFSVHGSVPLASSISTNVAESPPARHESSFRTDPRDFKREHVRTVCWKVQEFLALSQQYSKQQEAPEEAPSPRRRSAQSSPSRDGTPPSLVPLTPSDDDDPGRSSPLSSSHSPLNSKDDHDADADDDDDKDKAAPEPWLLDAYAGFPAHLPLAERGGRRATLHERTILYNTIRSALYQDEGNAAAAAVPPVSASLGSGLPDLAAVCLMNLQSPSLTRYLLERLATHHLVLLQDGQAVSAIATALMRLVDPQLQAGLKAAPGNLHAIVKRVCHRWCCTWFSQHVLDATLASRLFDLFLVSHPAMPIYVAVAMLLSDRHALLNLRHVRECLTLSWTTTSFGEPTAAGWHAAQRRLEGIVQRAAELMQRHPPRQLSLHLDCQRHQRVLERDPPGWMSLAKVPTDCQVLQQRQARDPPQSFCDAAAALKRLQRLQQLRRRRQKQKKKRRAAYGVTVAVGLLSLLVWWLVVDQGMSPSLLLEHLNKLNVFEEFARLTAPPIVPRMTSQQPSEAADSASQAVIADSSNTTPVDLSIHAGSNQTLPDLLEKEADESKEEDLAVAATTGLEKEQQQDAYLWINDMCWQSANFSTNDVLEEEASRRNFVHEQPDEELDEPTLFDAEGDKGTEEDDDDEENINPFDAFDKSQQQTQEIELANETLVACLRGQVETQANETQEDAGPALDAALMSSTEDEILASEEAAEPAALEGVENQPVEVRFEPLPLENEETTVEEHPTVEETREPIATEEDEAASDEEIICGMSPHENDWESALEIEIAAVTTETSNQVNEPVEVDDNLSESDAELSESSVPHGVDEENASGDLNQTAGVAPTKELLGEKIMEERSHAGELQVLPDLSVEVETNNEEQTNSARSESIAAVVEEGTVTETSDEKHTWNQTTIDDAEIEFSTEEEVDASAFEHASRQRMPTMHNNKTTLARNKALLNSAKAMKSRRGHSRYLTPAFVTMVPPRKPLNATQPNAAILLDADSPSTAAIAESGFVQVPRNTTVDLAQAPRIGTEAEADRETPTLTSSLEPPSEPDAICGDELGQEEVDDMPEKSGDQNDESQEKKGAAAVTTRGELNLETRLVATQSRIDTGRLVETLQEHPHGNAIDSIELDVWALPLVLRSWLHPSDHRQYYRYFSLEHPAVNVHDAGGKVDGRLGDGSGRPLGAPAAIATGGVEIPSYSPRIPPAVTPTPVVETPAYPPRIPPAVVPTPVAETPVYPPLLPPAVMPTPFVETLACPPLIAPAARPTPATGLPPQIQANRTDIRDASDENVVLEPCSKLRNGLHVRQFERCPALLPSDVMEICDDHPCWSSAVDIDNCCDKSLACQMIQRPGPLRLRDDGMLFLNVTPPSVTDAAARWETLGKELGCATDSARSSAGRKDVVSPKADDVKAINSTERQDDVGTKSHPLISMRRKLLHRLPARTARAMMTTSFPLAAWVLWV